MALINKYDILNAIAIAADPNKIAPIEKLPNWETKRVKNVCLNI